MIPYGFPAWAKINWTIEITGKNAKGYHTLRSLMQSIDLADEITLSPANEDSCSRGDVFCQDDLALRAWLLLKKKFGLKDCWQIHLQKRIPVGGGLGGGSSDAAAVLHHMNHRYQLGLCTEELRQLAFPLGADLPFCVTGGLAFVEGVGEIVQELPGREVFLLLFGPGMPVSTAAVYQAYDQLQPAQNDQATHINAVQDCLVQGNIAQIPEFWFNHLTQAAFSVLPLLKEMHDQAEALLHKPCLLSGSGGTMFCLESSEEEAKRDQLILRQHLPWVILARTRVNGNVKDFNCRR